ncbi:hypothetical protein ACG7TL_001694 [Trametes sanguinea]
MLPTELLVSIFLTLRDESPTTWLRVLLVCRGWYEIACSAGPLWSRLFFDERCRLNVFETFLGRSDSVKLDLNLDIHAVDGRSVLNIVHRHSAQFRTLTIAFSTHQTRLLQHCLEDPDFSRFVIDLKLHCLTAEAPQIFLQPLALQSLRSVQAIQVLPRSRRPLRNVASLELVQIWHVVRTGNEPLEQYDIVLAIGGFADLETLILRDALPPCAHFDSTAVDRVTLSALRKMDVNETIEDIKFFLHHLSLPETAQVFIVARVADAMWEAANAGVFLSILPDNRQSTLPMVGQSSALRLFAGHTEEGALSLMGGSDASTLSSDPAWSILLPDCGDLLEESTSVALEELSQLVAPSSLTHLELHIAPRILLFDSVDWQAVLRSLHCVRIMVVGSRWAAEGLVRALYQHQDLLPVLELLELCLGELLAETHAGPLPVPNETIPRRRIEKVVIVQADQKEAPYLEGTIIGSMIEASAYKFRHSICSACHVAATCILEPEVRGFRLSPRKAHN